MIKVLLIQKINTTGLEGHNCVRNIVLQSTWSKSVGQSGPNWSPESLEVKSKLWNWTGAIIDNAVIATSLHQARKAQKSIVSWLFVTYEWYFFSFLSLSGLSSQYFGIKILYFTKYQMLYSNIVNIFFNTNIQLERWLSWGKSLSIFDWFVILGSLAEWKE